jgi:vanadium chloroperoxidase
VLSELTHIYRSGHATFGAAGFQAARLHYKRRDNLTFAPDEPDNISFDFVSDELNGINRDLRQPYDPNLPITDQLGTVRTRVVRRFPSLWAAIFDNAVSRIFLGVHWRFDAFASKDVLASAAPNADGTTAFKAPANIKYVTMGPRADRPGQLYPIGGVPLGIGIANDIFQSNLKPTPVALQPGNTAGSSAILASNIKANEVADDDRKDSGVGLSFVVQDGTMTSKSNSKD